MRRLYAEWIGRWAVAGACWVLLGYGLALVALALVERWR